jgi:AP-3 complex subunit delta-1
MFERTLQDLIRGLRAHKASSKAQEDAFLSEAMGEIRDELKGKDMALKAEGVVKMCYVSSPQLQRIRADGARS